MLTDEYHLEILNPHQKEILPRLSFLAKGGFYLVGGTAAALQIGHRTSVDFDFYCPSHFDQTQLFSDIESQFGSLAIKTATQKDTLFCIISSVDCSFFWYQHPLLKQPKPIQGTPVASLEDVAAMKLVAINSRPTARDYIDIYYLLQKFSLSLMLSLAQKKYPSFNPYFTLRALTYFEDINDQNKRPIKILDSHFSWEVAKKTIFTEVQKYQLSMFRA